MAVIGCSAREQRARLHCDSERTFANCPVGAQELLEIAIPPTCLGFALMVSRSIVTASRYLSSPIGFQQVVAYVRGDERAHRGSRVS